MNIDVASQLERIVALLNGHPFASIGAVLAILLVMGFQKDGLFSRYVGFLQARAEKEAALEVRRMEIISMLENRRQPSLPGLGNEEGERS